MIPFHSKSILTWVLQHIRAGAYGFMECVRSPFSSLVIVSVFAIAIAFPAGFYKLLKNFQILNGSWKKSTVISLFLKPGTSETNIHALTAALEKRLDLKQIRYISPESALDEFKKSTPFGDMLDTLPSNPLPAVIEIYPADAIKLPAELEKLYASFKSLQEVDFVELDLNWVKRLYYLIHLCKRIVFAIAFLFVFGIVFILSDTIKTATRVHQNEIVLLKLLGATPGFIRRPFLYRGFFYGLGGGLLAGLLEFCLARWLEAPAMLLAQTYGLSFVQEGLSLKMGGTMLTVSIFLALTTSWLTVQRYLRKS